MRLDLVLPNQGGFAEEALRAGPHFEAMGWDGLWLTDHVVGAGAYARHNAAYGAHWQEIMVSMAWLAAQTSRIRIGSGILVVPYRDPVVTAKMVSTLDLLSGGRIDLGVGTGWARREFMALGKGAIFERRGAYTDEALDVMLACWKGGDITHRGRFFDVEKVSFAPSPVQGERVPIWVGGFELAPAPLRRTAKYADYWHPTGITPDQVKEGGDRIDDMAGHAIKRSVRIRCDGDPAEAAAMLAQFKEAGCVMAACAFDAPTTFAEFERAAAALYQATEALRGNGKWV